MSVFVMQFHNFPRDFPKRLKIFAAEHDIPMTKLIVNVLEEYMRRESGKRSTTTSER